jgi:hypothetical protein
VAPVRNRRTQRWGEVWQTVRANERHVRKGNGAEGEVEFPGASPGNGEAPGGLLSVGVDTVDLALVIRAGYADGAGQATLQCRQGGL